MGVLYNNDTSERVHMLGAYTILLFAVWAVSGVGYLLSALIKPANVQLAAVIVVLVSLVSNGVFVPKNRMPSA